MSTPKKITATRAQLKMQIDSLHQLRAIDTQKIDELREQAAQAQIARKEAQDEARRSQSQMQDAEFRLHQNRSLVTEYSLLVANPQTAEDKDRVIHLQKMIAGTQGFPMPERLTDRHRILGQCDEPHSRRAY